MSFQSISSVNKSLLQTWGCSVLYVLMSFIFTWMKGSLISSSSKMISPGSTTEKYDIVSNVAICNVISNWHLLQGQAPVTQLQNHFPRQSFCTKALPRKRQWESKAISWDIKLENFTNAFINCLWHYFKWKSLSSQQIKWFFSEETDFWNIYHLVVPRLWAYKALYDMYKSISM